jgi:exonuclease VII large subunit
MTSNTTTTSTKVLKYEKYENRYLPEDFCPGETDVVCARGKSYWEHTGNKMYRALIAGATERYSATSNKLEKTMIVSEIVNAVHKQQGMFVKKEKKGGPWVEVDEVFAREKIGQSLRDGLHDKYRSATKAKKQRKEKLNERFNGDIDRVIHGNASVSRRIEELTREVRTNGALASDYSIVTLFSRANSDILETIKKDSSMLHQFQDATVASKVEESC